MPSTNQAQPHTDDSTWQRLWIAMSFSHKQHEDRNMSVAARLPSGAYGTLSTRTSHSPRRCCYRRSVNDRLPVAPVAAATVRVLVGSYQVAVAAPLNRLRSRVIVEAPRAERRSPRGCDRAASSDDLGPVPTPPPPAATGHSRRRRLANRNCCATRRQTPVPDIDSRDRACSASQR